MSFKSGVVSQDMFSGLLEVMVMKNLVLIDIAIKRTISICFFLMPFFWLLSFYLERFFEVW